MKVARTVLRGPRRSNAPGLPDAAIRGFKLAEKVSGCWRTLTTLRRHCRIRSYLVSARNHGRRPLDAIRDALNTTPWMPPHKTTTSALAA